MDKKEQNLSDENQNKKDNHIKMDYSLDNISDRIKKVEEIIAETPPERLTSYYLTKMADYLIDLTLTKEEKKKGFILTKNKMVTVEKRETSFEGLVNRLENGEDGIYNLIRQDKNIIFSPKVTISEQDEEDIPALKQLREALAAVEEMTKKASGKRRSSLWKQTIEMRQDQYIIRTAYRKPIYSTNLIKSISRLNLEDHISIDPKTQEPINETLIDLFNPKHISVLLQNYSKIVEETWDSLSSDSRWMIWDLEDLIEKHIRYQDPIGYFIIIAKIDGLSNEEIQNQVFAHFNKRYSVEYISSLWRQRLPRKIAEGAKQDYVLWYWKKNHKLSWKKCSRCGQCKPAHKYFFTKNSSSSDGFYSQCKSCRSEKYYSAKKK